MSDQTAESTVSTGLLIPPETVLDVWMNLALQEAQAAAEVGEVPVGAVVVRLELQFWSDPAEAVVGWGRDRRLELHDPCAHAEVLALRQAGQATGDWRLEHCALVVTLEPCLMCAGATLLARIPLLVFGADNPKFGAVGSQMDALSHHGWNHDVRVLRGIQGPRCAQLLQTFFRRLRRS
jgi:tRNA(adenine34) deaminase